MKRRVLVSGASVAGSTTAYWLARHGFDVTIVEKAPAFRDGGQNVDVRGAGREVLRRMGLEEAANAKTTGERGTDWVDEKDGVVARFTVDEIGDGPTAEMEILRGDIAKLVFEAANPQTAFRFGDAIANSGRRRSRRHRRLRKRREGAIRSRDRSRGCRIPDPREGLPARGKVALDGHHHRLLFHPCDGRGRPLCPPVQYDWRTGSHTEAWPGRQAPRLHRRAEGAGRRGALVVRRSEGLDPKALRRGWLAIPTPS